MTSFQDDEGMWHIHAKLPAENVDQRSNDKEVLPSTVPFKHRRVDALATMAEHTKWEGEKMDYDMAISGLLSQSG